jgi:biopolymer transport protein ExbD
MRKPPSHRTGGQIDLTALIDVVFLLLIFFMVSSVFRKDELALLLNLPQSQSGNKATSQDAEQKPILVEINEEELGLNGKKVSIIEFEAQLQELNKQKSLDDSNAVVKPVVHLRVDKGVRYEKMIQIIDLLKNQDYQQISLFTEK